MFEPVTVESLYNVHKDSLRLTWLSSKDNASRTFRRDPEEFCALVGYLNFVHPQQIPVLGTQEFTYLAKLDVIGYQSAIQQLFAAHPILVIIADEQAAFRELLTEAEATQTPLISSQLPAQMVIDHLSHYLVTRLSATITVHGVFMEVFDRGVLLTGASGVGKSELALELINRGHRLVADDSPTFSRIAPDTLSGMCPPLLQNFLEVRGLGIINVHAMFGDTAVKDRKQLHLIVNVVDVSDEQLRTMDRLQGIHRERQLLGVNIPEVTIPAAPGRSLAILVEAAVRNQVLKLGGYDASAVFNSRQYHELISQSTPPT